MQEVMHAIKGEIMAFGCKHFKTPMNAYFLFASIGAHSRLHFPKIKIFRDGKKLANEAKTLYI